MKCWTKIYLVNSVETVARQTNKEVCLGKHLPANMFDTFRFSIKPVASNLQLESTCSFNTKSELKRVYWIKFLW